MVEASKPATRLINAWVAGCIPLAVREPAYVELARDREDALLFDDLGECGPLLDDLRDSALVKRLERGVTERGIEFSPERTTQRWLDACRGLELVSRRPSSLRRRLSIREKRLSHFVHEASGAIRD